MSDISDNVQNLTLEYLMNPLQYDKYVQGRLNHSFQENKEKNRRFYRKRIVHLTKEMTRNIFPTASLREAYRNYADILVDYFKSLDTQDILQSHYKDIVTEDTPTTKLLDPKEQETSDLSILATKHNHTTGASIMESFVLRDKPSPSARVSPPTIRTVTLDDPVLRNKGVKTSKTKKISN